MTTERVFALHPSAVDRYARHGYVVLEGLLGDADVEALRAECERLADDVVTVAIALGGPHPRLHARRRGDRVVLQKISPVADASPIVAGMASDDRLLQVVRALIDAPTLIEEKLIYKQEIPAALALHTEPGTDEYPFHTDWAYYRAEGYPRETLELGIAIDPATPANGCLRVVPGSHAVDFPVRVDGPPDVRPEAVPVDDIVDVPLRPGDAVVFASALVHGSHDNPTASPRRMLILTYAPAGSGGDPDRRNAAYRREALAHEEAYRQMAASDAAPPRDPLTSSTCAATTTPATRTAR